MYLLLEAEVCVICGRKQKLNLKVLYCIIFCRMYVLQEAKVKGGTLYVSRNKVLYSMLQKQKL